MTDDKLYTSLSANTIMAKVTNHFQRTKLITSSTDKHYSLDSEDDFRSGCRNVSHQQQFFSELHSPGRSYYTNKTNYCLGYYKCYFRIKEHDNRTKKAKERKEEKIKKTVQSRNEVRENSNIMNNAKTYFFSFLFN